MAKWMWALALGGFVTFFIHKTKRSYTWLAGAMTAALTLWLWKQG